MYVLEAVAWTDRVQAISAGTTAVLTLVLTAVAVWAGCTGVKTMKASKQASEAATAAAREAQLANEQTRRDSIEATRPYVYAQITPGLSGVACWDIRISNTGRSCARELHLSYDSWPKQVDDVAVSVRTLLHTPRSLPPGCSIRAIWRLEAEPGAGFDDGTTAAGMPTGGKLTVRYPSDDPSGVAYRDVFDVTITDAGLWPVPEAGPEPTGLHGEARAFYLLGRALVRRIGELGR